MSRKAFSRMYFLVAFPLVALTYVLIALYLIWHDSADPIPTLQATGFIIGLGFVVAVVVYPIFVYAVFYFHKNRR